MNYKRVKKIFMNEGTAGAEDSSSFDNDDDNSSQVLYGSNDPPPSPYCTALNKTIPSYDIQQII
jgi:hypothetical protein